MLEQLYLVENECSFRLVLPRNKKRSTDENKLVVVPLKWANHFITALHTQYAHPSCRKLFESARVVCHIDKLYELCNLVAKSCSACQHAKINRSVQTPPLTSSEKTAIGRTWYVDHKILSRCTPGGYKFVLVFCDHYPGYSFFELVKSTSALETVKVFIKRILTEFPESCSFVSDKGTAFANQMFKLLTSKILGGFHFYSASRQAQSHGTIENVLSHLAKQIPLFCSSDSEIEDALPLIEIAHRVLPQISTG